MRARCGALQALNAEVTTIVDWVHNRLSPQHTPTPTSRHWPTLESVQCSFGVGLGSQPRPTASMPTTAMRRNVFGKGRFHPDSMGCCGSGWRFAATPEANVAAWQRIHRRRTGPHRVQWRFDHGSPSVEVSMALGTFPFLDVHLGIPVGIAADPVASSGTDLFFEMRIALAAERSRANAHSISQRIAVSDVQFGHRDVCGWRPWGLARLRCSRDKLGRP